MSLQDIHGTENLTSLRGTGRIARRAGLVLALLGLGGCVNDASPGMTLEQSMATTTTVALVSPDRSVAKTKATLPVEAGRVLAIHGYNSGQGFRQDIILDGGAIKGIADSLVILSNTDTLESRDSALSVKPSEPSIKAELASRFPNIPMSVATRPFANAYGPYGLALGRGPGDTRCVYAWQWIDDASNLSKTGMNGPISLRVTLCRRGQTFDDMAALVDRLVIGGNATDGVAVAALNENEVLGSNGHASKAHERTRHPKIASHKPAHHMTHAQKAVKPDEDTSIPQSAAMPNGSTPRFMAPVAGAMPGGMQQGFGDLTSVTKTATTAPDLSQDLPPQAYLGPRGGSNMKAATTPRPEPTP